MMSTSDARKTTSRNYTPDIVPKDFLNKLGEMHAAERELTIAIPLMIAAAKSKDLKTLLKLHLKETKNHLKTIDEIGVSLDKDVPTKTCKGMTRLVAEGTKVMAKRVVGVEGDAALIAVGRKIEQFEIDAYTELCQRAKELSYDHELAMLTSILDQETLADELLGALADGKGPIKELIEQASLKHAGAKR